MDRFCWDLYECSNHKDTIFSLNFWPNYNLNIRSYGIFKHYKIWMLLRRICINLPSCFIPLSRSNCGVSIILLHISGTWKKIIMLFIFNHIVFGFVLIITHSPTFSLLVMPVYSQPPYQLGKPYFQKIYYKVFCFSFNVCIVYTVLSSWNIFVLFYNFSLITIIIW